MNLPGSSEVSLAFLMECSAKTTILLAFTWVIARAVRHRSSAFRHLAWAAGILGSLTLPLLSLLLPAWHSAALGNAAGLLGPAHAVAADSGSPTLPAMIVDAGAASPLLGKFANVALLVCTPRLLFFPLRLGAGRVRLRRTSTRASV